MRCGETSNSDPSSLFSLVLEKTSSHSQMAVSKTAISHQSCLSFRLAASVPGTSGGKPKEGATKKMVYPASPQSNPLRQLLIPPRRVLAAPSSKAKPAPKLTLATAVKKVRSQPFRGCQASASC